MPLLFILFSIHTLQNNVWLVWFLDSDHIDNSLINHRNCFGKRSLTYFTFKFGEIVADNNIIQLFFNLAIYPIFQATNMDKFT